VQDYSYYDFWTGCNTHGRKSTPLVRPLLDKGESRVLSQAFADLCGDDR
jgi:hypothetical protein